MKRDEWGISSLQIRSLESQAAERCDCLPLSSLYQQAKQDEAGELRPVTPATPELNSYLRASLAEQFPRSAPLSVLLLHISQLEYLHIAPNSAVLHRRQRYHAPSSFLEQVLANILRTIRSSDEVITHGGTGAAIILPGVDQEGAFGIVERVFHSVSLLQSETVIPPLKRETDIFIGIGTYPKPGGTLEELLYHTSSVAHRLTMRPAVSTPRNTRAGEHDERAKEEEELNKAGQAFGVPFMCLPERVPARLKQLIPYQLARELRCAPVGRDHNRLTVAMARPNDSETIHLLRQTTSMVIFPVSCELTALDSLLSHEW